MKKYILFRKCFPWCVNKYNENVIIDEMFLKESADVIFKMFCNDDYLWRYIDFDFFI